MHDVNNIQQTLGYPTLGQPAAPSTNPPLRSTERKQKGRIKYICVYESEFIIWVTYYTLSLWVANNAAYRTFTKLAKA
jgi:hypothetical protein